MKLSRLQDVEFSDDEKVFKESALRQLIFATFLGTLSLGIYHWHKFGLPLIFVYFSGGSLLVFAIFVFNIFIKTLSADNWLIRINHEKIVIKFRSFLNRHLPDTDKQIVSIPLNEIKEVREVSETIKTISPFNIHKGPRLEFFTNLEIILNSVDTKELKERLKYEVNVKTNTGYHHYPVNLINDDRIIIEWQSAKTRITPGIKRMLELFATYRVKVAVDAKETKDYRETNAVNKAEIETRILDLVQKGKLIEAKALAKQAYNCSLAEADSFVKELLGR